MNLGSFIHDNVDPTSSTVYTFVESLSLHTLNHRGKILQVLFKDRVIRETKPLPVLLKFLNNLLDLTD